MKRYLLLVLSLLVAGCVSGGGDDVPTGERRTNQVVFGRVQLDRPFADATVTFRTLDGTTIETLGPVTTMGDGTFRAEFREVPQRFVAVATGFPVAGGPQETYESEYDGIDPAQEQVVITPLTSLVVSFHDQNPDLSYAEADQAVREQLNLPAHQTTRYHMVNGAHRRGFSVTRFLENARAGNPKQGETISALTTVTYDDVDPVTVDDSGSSDWASAGAQLSIAVISDVLQDFAGLAGTAVISWTSALLDTDEDFTEVADLLEDISEEITEVYDDLSEEITDATFTESVAALNDELGTITATVDLLVDYQQNGDASEAEVDELLEECTETSYLGLLATIHNAQLGTDSATGLMAELISLQDLDDVIFYSNTKTYNPIASEFNYYAGFETQLINTILEGFHGQTPPEAQTAQNWYDTYAEYVQIQEGLVPLPLDSDNVIGHRASGLIFYATEQSADTYENAVAKADSFTEAGYTNWRVATYADLYVLLYNREPDSASTKSFEKPTISIDDLEDAGFTLVQHSNPINYGSYSYVVGAEYSAYEPGIKKVAGQSDYCDCAGLYELSVGDQYEGLAVGVGWWKETGNKLPYFLVCDAVDQDVSLRAAMGTLTGMFLTLSDDDQMRAFGTYDLNFMADGLYYVNTPLPELTEVVAWSSSDTSVLRVQNQPTSATGVTTLTTTPDINVGAGAITWLGAGSVTVTASLYDPWSSDLTQYTATYDLTESSSDYTAPTLESILITPASLTFTATGNTEVWATGFYSDGTSATLTDVTWMSSISDAHVTESGNDEFFLFLDAIPSGVSSFTLTATSSGVSGTLTVSIVQ